MENISPVEFETLRQQKDKRFWVNYLRLWFKNYDIQKDPYSEYVRIMDIISKDPSKMYEYGQESFIQQMKQYYLQKFIQEARTKKKLQLFLVFLEMPPEEIVKLCKEESIPISKKGNNKFWINYYLRWLRVDPFKISTSYYQQLEDIVHYVEDVPSLIFLYGSDKYIESYIGSLNLNNQEIVQDLFIDAAQYGRKKWLKWFWETYKEFIDIDTLTHAFRVASIDRNMDFGIDVSDNSINRAEISTETMEWLWEISNGEIDVQLDDIGFGAASKWGSLGILKFILKKADPPIDIHAYDDYAFVFAVINEHIDVQNYIRSLDPDYDWDSIIEELEINN